MPCPLGIMGVVTVGCIECTKKKARRHILWVLAGTKYSVLVGDAHRLPSFTPQGANGAKVKYLEDETICHRHLPHVHKLQCTSSSVLLCNFKLHHRALCVGSI
jgi:hypothetical protein